MEFPLYENLYKKVKKNSYMRNNQKKEVIDMINEIDDNGRHILIVLICMYNQKHTDNSNNVIPYEGKYSQKNDKLDIEWNFEIFPNRLKHIVHMYLKMHISDMKIVKLKEQMS